MTPVPRLWPGELIGVSMGDGALQLLSHEELVDALSKDSQRPHRRADEDRCSGAPCLELLLKCLANQGTSVAIQAPAGCIDRLLTTHESTRTPLQYVATSPRSSTA